MDFEKSNFSKCLIAKLKRHDAKCPNTHARDLVLILARPVV